MLLLKLLFKRTIKNDEKIKEEFLRIYNLTEVQAADDHENLASHLINDHLLYIMVLGIFGIAILITVCFNPLAVAKLGIENPHIDAYDIEHQI